MNAGAMPDVAGEGGSNWRLSKLLELEAAVRDLCYAASLPAFVALIMRACVCVCVASSSLFVLASLCMCACVCESIMETRHAGNANKKEVPHKKLAAGLASGIAKPKPKYAYQIYTSAPQDIQHFIDLETRLKSTFTVELMTRRSAVTDRKVANRFWLRE